MYLTLGGVAFADVEQLADHLEDRGRRGLLEHPGQGHPAQWYLDRLPRNQAERESAEACLWDAATRLIKRSDEPSVLSMAGAVCGACRSEPFFHAVLDRLEGLESPLPAEVSAMFVQMLPAWFPATHARLGPRIRSYLLASGRHDERVEVLLAADPDGELLEEFERAAQTHQLTETVARRVAGALCRGRRAELLDAARRLAPAERSVREAFRNKVKARAADWFANHGPSLGQALDL